MNKEPKKRETKDVFKKADSFSKRAAYFVMQMILGLILLGGAGWWGYTQVMKYVLGRYDLFGLKENLSSIYGEADVILVNPVRTEKYIRREGEDAGWPYKPREDDWKLADTLWYAEGKKRPVKKKDTPEIEAWRLLSGGTEDVAQKLYWEQILLKQMVSYKIVEEPDLVNLPAGYGLLIIPGALLLSEDEKEGIKEFVSSGGNLLATWLTGCRDEKGNWAGFNFLSYLMGGTAANEVKDVSGGTSIILSGDSPITAFIPPGLHLELFTYNGYTTFNLFEPRTSNDGFWFKPYWKSNPSPNWGSGSLLAHGTYVEGKFVWMGFTPSSIQGNKNNTLILDRLIKNSLDWLQDKPLVTANVWPPGYRSGGAILVESQGSEAVLEEVLTNTTKEDISCDLVITRNFKPSSINLRRVEIGDVIYHLEPFELNEEFDLKKQLTGQSSRLKKIIGFQPLGLFPHDWSYDGRILDAAVRAGFRFLLAEPEPREYGPDVHTAVEKGWILFSRRIPVTTMPKAQLSLWEWNRLKGVRGSENLLKVMERDLKRIHHSGGIYLGIINPEILNRENAIDFPVKLAAEMDTLGMWRATTKQLLDRYGGWMGLRATTRQITDSRIQLNLSNEGLINLTNVVYQLYASNDYTDITLKPQKIGVGLKKIGWNAETGVCTFLLTEIGKGDNVTILADFQYTVPEDTTRHLVQTDEQPAPKITDVGEKK